MAWDLADEVEIRKVCGNKQQKTAQSKSTGSSGASRGILLGASRNGDGIPGAAVPLSSLAGCSRAKAGSRALRVLAERSKELIKQEIGNARHILNYGKAGVTSFGVRAACFRRFA